MFFSSLLDRLTNRNVPRRSSKSNRTREARRSAFRGSLRKDLRLEALEDRRLLSIDFSFTGVLGSNSDDYLGVSGQQDGRVVRDGVPSVSGENKVYPGTIQAGTDFAFDDYRFANLSASTSAVAVTWSGTAALVGEGIFSVAYLGPFNPADVAQNYRGDAGSSITSAEPGPNSYVVDIPAQASFEVVVSDVDSAGGNVGMTYDVTVSLDITDVVVPGTAGDDDIVITGTGPGTGTITVNGDTPIPFSNLNSITVDGGDGDDTLIVDFSTANPLPAGGLLFNGGGQTWALGGDRLAILGTFTTQTLNYTGTSAGGNDGNVDLDGSVITYTGLEPIHAGNAADTILNLPLGTANHATLQDSADAGEIEIVDNGATFEDTVIPNPTNSLTVNLGDQGDVLNVTTLDANYAASLIINGGNANDNVQLNNVDLQDTPGRGLLVTETETLGITGGTISGNSAAGDGGGILIVNSASGTTALLNGVTISGNTASNDGGGIYNDGATLTVINSTLESNTADRGGGGIANADWGTVDVRNSVLTGNVAANWGGGIWNWSGTLTVTKSMLASNATNWYGGGIMNQGTFTVEASTIDGNEAGDGGGIWSDGDLTLEKMTVISGNTAKPFAGSVGKGGGLYLTIGGAATNFISATSITGNTALGNGMTDGGGGIFSYRLALTLDWTVSITDNHAAGANGSGGGIFNDGGTLTLVGLPIAANTANRAGGGIETLGGTVTLVGVTLGGPAPADGNRADGGGNGPGNGGGLHVTGAGTVNVLGSVIENNFAAAEGGGLWNSATGSLTLDASIGDVLVANNTAAGDAAPGIDGVAVQGGGGIFNDGGAVAFINTDNHNAVIISNNAAAGANFGSGGGILSIAGSVDGGAGNPATNVLIGGNTAVRAGGGVEIVNGSLSVENSLIDGNSAGGSSGNGGAIHIAGNGSATLDAVTISHNTAANEGGGLWNSAGGTFVLTNTTISGNAATNGDGGGIFSTGGGSGVVDLDSVTITLNSAGGSGAGIASGADGAVIESTIVAQNPGGGTEDNLSGTVGGQDFNLIGDPDDGTLLAPKDQTIFNADALLGPLADNANPNQVNGSPIQTHLPSAGSPAIGFGRTALAVDQRDVLRPQGQNDDIGAVEVQLNGFVVSAADLAASQMGDGNPDEFLVIMDGQGTAATFDDEVVVFVNSTEVQRWPAVTTGLIVIRGSADDDTMITDNSQGLIRANLVFDADGAVDDPLVDRVPGGFDILILRGSTPTTTTYNPGETPDAGAVFQEHNQVVQRVEFFGLEPVQVVGTGAGDTLNVAAAALGAGFPQALNADNAINYAEGPNSSQPFDPVFAGATTGLITIDGFESLEFSNFGTLNIDAGAGSDEIHLNNPVKPVSLSTINVAGGDPTAGSDTVIVNGDTTDDEIVVSDITVDGATIDVTLDASGAAVALPTVIVTAAEQIVINGQGGGDALTLDGTAIDDTTTIGAQQTGAGTFRSGLSPLLDFLSFTTVTVNPGTGGFDRVVINGTEGPDEFTTPAADAVELTGGVRTILGSTGAVNLDQLEINALGGDDKVTLDADLTVAGLSKIVDAGDGNDSVDLAGITSAGWVTIFGGQGNDLLVGADIPVATQDPGDTIDGGPGNDQVTGGVGNDRLFGGDGSDIFVWDQGDGSDLVEGEGGGVDVLRFNGATAAQLAVEDFTLSANTPAPNTAARLLLNRAQGDVKLDVAGVEQVDINGDSGVETFDVNDLTQTELKVLNLHLWAAGNTESVTVNGRNLDDNLHVTLADGIVNVSGLRYDVNVAGAVAEPDDDRLTVSGHDGHDTITIGDNAEGAIDVTLDGGAGDDRLIAGAGHASTDTILNGDAGDDSLQGGSGADQLNGNAGEDTFVGGAGNDTIDGGAGFDTILISGTSGIDSIDVAQPDGTTLRYAISGVIGVAPTETDTLVAGSVEEARVVAGAGADVIRVRHADSLVATPGVSLRMTVEGGAGNAEDRLGVVDDGDGDLVIQRQGADDQSGSISVGPLAPVVYEQVEFVQVVPLDSNTGGTGTDGLGRLLIFKHDPYESNDSRLNAYFLGSGPTLNIDPKVDPGADGVFLNLPGDEDWYRFVAAYTGSLDFQVYFTQVGTLANSRAGLPGDGNLDIEVRDASGDLITGFGVNDANNDERVRIPAVEGQTYYLRVRGATPEAINQYTVTVINQLPPVPYNLELDDNPANGQTNPPGTQTDTSDTGRSQFDNHTYDKTPTLYFRLDDGIFLHDLPGNAADDTPPDEVIRILFQPGVGADLTQPTTAGFAIGIFDEGNSGDQTGTAPQTPLGFATATTQDGVYTFTVPDGKALSDGSHFLTARVQMIDPADPKQTGWGPRSQSLEIVVDTDDPPVFFGLEDKADTTQGLAAAGDSGVAGYAAKTNVDRITNDTTPTFFGTAEADAVVRLYVESTGDTQLQSRESGAATPDLFLGEAVAVPLDGTNQFLGGQWQIVSMLDLNDPVLLDLLGNKNGVFDDAQDGLRRLYVTGEDVAGNITPDGDADLLNIFVDTRGPQVTQVFVNVRNNPNYSIWDHKGTPHGNDDGYLKPTPLVDSLVIDVRDLPNRVNLGLPAPNQSDFTYRALFEEVSTNLGHYRLVGDAYGVIPIESITFTSDAVTDGKPATGYVTITFFEPLPDDRYTLTLADDITDRAGNALDGESHTTEPHDTPATLPSGDFVPGGDFVARFTVDSRPEVGVYDAGSVWMDTNGTWTFDPDNLDYTNRDIVYMLGYSTDTLFAGNFAPLHDDPSTVGVDERDADGFDKLAAFGRVGNNFRWLIDTDNDGVPEDLDGDGQLGVKEPMGTTGMPVAGNFDNIAANGDEVGLLAGNTWYFDTNHDYKLDKVVTLSLTGLPIVGDFDGDGDDDLGTWKDDQFTFQMATGPGVWSNTVLTIDFGFIGVREIPVAADMDGDEIDDIGLWVPDRVGVAGVENGEWYLLVSNDRAGTKRVAGSVGTLNHPFTPIPFGKDIYASFGDDFALPLLGNFDPPAAGSGGSESGILLTNPDNRFDVNADGPVNALDVLLLVNDQNVNGSRQLTVGNLGGPYLDVNGDGWATPGDIVGTINHINGQSAAGGEGEAAAVADDAWATVPVLSSAASPIPAAAESLTSVQYAGLLAEPGPASSAGTVQSAAEQVDQYFASDADRADDLPVYAAGLSDAAAAGVGRTSRQTPAIADAVTPDDVWADLAKDQGRPEDEEADAFFSQLGQLLQRLV